MLSLRDLQVAIRDHALDKGGTQAAAEAITDTHPIAPDQRLNIHRNATLLGLSGAMAALFPVVLRLVGEEFFHHMSKTYLKSRPTKDPVLYRLGTEFPEFITNFEAANALPYLPDVARLEAAWTYAYHAEDATPITATALLEFPEDRLGDIVLTPLPSARLVASSYPISAIWAANLPDIDEPPAVNLDDGGETILIYRPHMDVLVRRLSAGAFSFFMALSAGQSIAMALESAMTTDPTFSVIDELRALLLAQCFREAKLP